MDDEYIKREDVIKVMWKALYDYEDKTEKQFADDPNLDVSEWFTHRIFVQVIHAKCLDVVEAIPSADVAEVKHGEWKENDYNCLECSACHDQWIIKSAKEIYKFCPNCGACMREERDARRNE